LATASPTSTDISVQIYVWAENVKLGCTTATQVEVLSQGDEMTTGPVQKMATNLAYGMNMLSYIPMIKPLAKASEMVFKGIAGIASWFGWSRPVVVTETHYVKNEPFRNGSQVIGSETCKKISMDPRQELTIDPSILGTSEDELSIAFLCKRESYLTQFTWASSDTRMAVPIFVCRVHPQLDSYGSAMGSTTTNYWIQPTSMSFCAAPFQYWRGDITFRFDIVCSAYHRGKILVGYEPNIAQEALIIADIDLNKNYVSIIDIQETQSVSFCVKWAQARAWMRMLPYGSTPRNYGAAFTVANSAPYVNGFIFVTPFTELTSPNGSSVSVNVFVSSDNMLFQQPTASNFHVNRRIVTEGKEDDDAKNDVEVSCIDLNTSSASLKGISELHFGEQILSLRPLLHRYCTVQVLSVAASAAGPTSLVHTCNNLPSPYPLYTAAIVSLQPALINYLMFGYVGVRGGGRRRSHAYSHGTASNVAINSMGPMSRVNVNLHPPSTPASGSVAWASGAAIASFDGTVSFVPLTNGGIEYEIPYYSNNLFHFSFASNGVGTNPTDDMNGTWSSQHDITMEVSDSSQDTNTVVSDFAISDDFTLMKFNGSPFFKVNALV